jgi:hypothetical protein
MDEAHKGLPSASGTVADPSSLVKTDLGERYPTEEGYNL